MRLIPASPSGERAFAQREEKNAEKVRYFYEEISRRVVVVVPPSPLKGKPEPEATQFCRCGN